MKIYENMPLLFSILLIISSVAFIGCGKEDAEPEEPKITCTSGCSTMSWKIVDESGPTVTDETCKRDWQGNEYIETCNGKITYSNSGNSYTYKVIYDWIDCDITVTVNGLGDCFHE